MSLNAITRRRLFGHIHMLLDIAALALAWYLTIVFRVRLNAFMPAHVSGEELKKLVPHPLVIVALWGVVAQWLGIYRRRDAVSAGRAIRQALESDIIACAMAIVVTVFSRGLSNDFSRSFVLVFGPISLLLLGVSFYLAAFIAITIERRWMKPKRIAVVGEMSDAHPILKNLHGRNSSLTLTGLILPERAAHTGHHPFRVLGTLGQLAELVNREQLDQLICVSNVPGHLELCGAVSTKMGITLSRPFSPGFGRVRLEVSSDYGVHLIDAEPVGFPHGNLLAKRVLDIAASCFLLVALSPLLLLLAFLIRLTSKGPVFYKSPRVGKGGRHFMFWKFRSMYVDGPSRKDLLHKNESAGHLFKMRNDPRVTPLGRVMRRYSLDELPQLFNVLKGEMSLVGPRPLPAEDLDPDGLSSAHAQWSEKRTQVQPGITGFWQIHGRSDLKFEDMVHFDLEYIRNQSLKLDVQILLETPLAVFSGRGAY